MKGKVNLVWLAVSLCTFITGRWLALELKKYTSHQLESFGNVNLQLCVMMTMTYFVCKYLHYDHTCMPLLASYMHMLTE